MEQACSLFKILSKNYPFAECNFSGKSLLGREIPLLHIGNGEKAVLLVAGADGTDSISERLLLRFSEDICLQIARQNTVYGINCAYLAQSRRILILPRLNPDGRALFDEGPDPECPLYERQLRQNGMKSDFSSWQGNARGVRLDLNFNDDFAQRRSAAAEACDHCAIITGEFPESEPESAFVTHLVRVMDPVFLLECSHTITGAINTIYTNRPNAIQKIVSNLPFSVSNQKLYGLPSWFSATYTRCGAHLLCNLHQTTEKAIYEKFREFLFRSLYTLAV